MSPVTDTTQEPAAMTITTDLASLISDRDIGGM